MNSDERSTPGGDGVDGRDRVHVWKRCHACNARPIVGPAFECRTCPDGPDNDLCERCHAAYQAGRVEHPMRGSMADLGGVRAVGPHSFRRQPGISRLACLHWNDVHDARASAPPVPDHFVVRPEFRAKKESFIGSYGFIAAGQPNLFITCLHVMSSLIQATSIDTTASNPSYSGRELPRLVTEVNLYDVFAPHWMGARIARATSMLALPDARTRDEEPFSQRDIAAFVVDDAVSVAPVPLAPRVPEVGEPIWLAVKTEGGQKRRTIAAVVVEKTEATFIFRYLDDAADMPRFGSGAPLLDHAGQVVAINVGMGKFDGRHVGHGHHVDSIRRHLNMAIPHG